MRPIGAELVTTISQQPPIWEPPSHYSMDISLSASHFIAACRMCCFVWIRRDYKLFCKQSPQTICPADIDCCLPSNHDHIPTNIICFELQKPAIRLGLSKDDLIIKCAFYLLVLDNFDININEIGHLLTD